MSSRTIGTIVASTIFTAGFLLLIPSGQSEADSSVIYPASTEAIIPKKIRLKRDEREEGEYSTNLKNSSSIYD